MLIRGWVDERGWEVGGRSGKAKDGLGHRQSVVLCSQQTTGMYTNHRIDPDGHWQQFGTQPFLISALQWANRPVMHELGFTGSAKSCL